MSYKELNLPEQIKYCKGLERKYFNSPKWKKKQILYELLECVENMDMPEVVYADEELTITEWAYKLDSMEKN